LEPEISEYPGMNEDMAYVNKGEPLNHKVALLINNHHFGGYFLALSLASYGADVALVVKAENMEEAKETKKYIEAMGRRCLIIRREELSEATFSKEVVNRTIAEFGRLDIFIDHSVLSSQKSFQGNQGDPMQLANKKAHFSATLDTLATVLNHIVNNK
jgi:hypothetical protein